MTQQTNDNSVPSAPNGGITLIADNSVQPLPMSVSPQPRKSERSLLTMSKEDLERIKILAEMYSASSFNGSKNPLSKGDYFIIMVKGYALGFKPENAPDLISVIQGKPVIDAKGMLALIMDAKTDGEIEDIQIDTQETYCTVTMKRKGLPAHSETFSIEDAMRMTTTSWENNQKKTIPLAEKDNWKQQPRTMLKWRAVAACARAYCPDIIGGLYSKEELADNVTVFEDGTMNLPDLITTPPSASKREQKLAPNVTSLPTSANGNHAKPSTNGSATFSNGENPPPPVELDPLAFNPVPAPKSDEPDPNDPEDIRHAIPIYGADHWYVKHYLAFVKLLREVIPNQDSMVNHEVSAEGLRLIGKPIWKEFPSGASAITALKAKLGIKDTPTPPVTTPKPAPVPVPTPQPEVSTNWQKEFAQWLWDFLDIASIEQYEVMSGKQVSDYATLKDATEDATSIAQAKQWTICSYRATYVKKGEKTTYIEFQGLFPVRMYGRSSTFKTQVGEGYYTANGVDKWEANQTYKIEGLRVRWQYDQNRIAIASKVEPIQYELDEPPLDLTPEELEAMAKVDI